MTRWARSANSTGLGLKASTRCTGAAETTEAGKPQYSRSWRRLHREGALDATQLALCWTGIFFFASAAASSTYLTVSESFPLEARALAIALFYSLGTALGVTKPSAWRKVATGGLAAAERGECGIPAIHLMDPETGEFNRSFLR